MTIDTFIYSKETKIFLIKKIETKADGSYMVVAGLNSNGEDSFERKRTNSISSVASVSQKFLKLKKLEINQKLYII